MVFLASLLEPYSCGGKNFVIYNCIWDWTALQVYGISSLCHLLSAISILVLSTKSCMLQFYNDNSIPYFWIGERHCLSESNEILDLKVWIFLWVINERIEGLVKSHSLWVSTSSTSNKISELFLEWTSKEQPQHLCCFSFPELGEILHYVTAYWRSYYSWAVFASSIANDWMQS